MKDFSVKIRKVLSQNGTLYISIPKEFAERLGVRPGEKVVMIASAESIKLIPTKENV